MAGYQEFLRAEEKRAAAKKAAAKEVARRTRAATMRGVVLSDAEKAKLAKRAKRRAGA